MDASLLWSVHYVSLLASCLSSPCCISLTHRQTRALSVAQCYWRHSIDCTLGWARKLLLVLRFNPVTWGGPVWFQAMIPGALWYGIITIFIVVFKILQNCVLTPKLYIYHKARWCPLVPLQALVGFQKLSGVGRGKVHQTVVDVWILQVWKIVCSSCFNIREKHPRAMIRVCHVCDISPSFCGLKESAVNSASLKSALATIPFWPSFMVFP